MFGFNGRRRQLQHYLDANPQLLAAAVPGHANLSRSDAHLLADIALSFATRTAWEGTNGFDVTDEMTMVISAQAAMMALGLANDCFTNVKTVIISPSIMTLTGERFLGDGFYSREPQEVLGHTGFDGNIYVAWDEIDHRRHPEVLVVFHELAHALDEQDGVSNGTPPITDAILFDRWVESCEHYFDLVEHGGGPTCIDDYASENPAEFFAVVTEVFFGHPEELRSEAPDLYSVFSAFYGQDTITTAAT